MVKNKINYKVNPNTSYVYTECPWNRKIDGHTVKVATYDCCKCDYYVSKSREEVKMLKKYIYCVCNKQFTWKENGLDPELKFSLGLLGVIVILLLIGSLISK